MPNVCERARTVIRFLAQSLMPFVSQGALGSHADASLWVVTLLYVIILFGLFAWRMASFSLRLTYRPSWQLVVMRFLTLLGLHAFPIPIYAILSSPLNCKLRSTWGNTGLACYDSSHFGE